MEDDDVFIYADARFEIRPHPTYADLAQIHEFVNELGYTFPFSRKQFSLEDVQYKLRTEGPQAFLRYIRLQEDISPKAPFKRALAFVAERLAVLAPASELTIIDPYLFPTRPQLGVDEYSANLAALIAPIVEPEAKLRFVVNTRANSEVESNVNTILGDLVAGITIQIHHSEDFHDRFWVADRSRGVVVGTSLNGLGSKLFLMDSLNASDVATIVEILDEVPASEWK